MIGSKKYSARRSGTPSSETQPDPTHTLPSHDRDGYAVAVSINLRLNVLTRCTLDKAGLLLQGENQCKSTTAAMTWIDGAKLLADRIGEPPAKELVQVHANAPALFHWCNVNPAAIATVDVVPADARPAVGST